jgi:alkylation response protein AidB-like acyl-CoA dehydrogenase
MARRDLASGYLERAKSTEFPWEAYRQVARLGVLGLLAGPEHNPLDREDHVAAGLAVEELAYADFNLANAVIPVLLTSSLMSKWYGPLVASAAVKDCLLLHGHYGYAEEFGLEQRLRDVMAVEIADGTAQVQKIVIARERFGRAFLPYGRRAAI